MTLETQLQRGLREMSLDLPAAALEKLLRYLRLLEKWSRAYNLTAVRDPEQMIPRHLLDSLSVLPYVRGPRILDVGTGAGLPGIPLALVQEQHHFVLLDSNAKKTRFLNHVVRELQLQNVEVIQERVEKFQPERKFDTLITRAFAAIPDMLASCGHACAPQGRFLAMKGAKHAEELAAISEQYRVTNIQVLRVPGLDAVRHLVIIQPNTNAAP